MCVTSVRVLMLNSFADEEALMAAILAGESGDVLKRIMRDGLVNDIRVGRKRVAPRFGDDRQAAERLREGPREDSLLSKFTNQERTIVRQIAEGLTNHEIAEEMFLAE